MDCCLPMIIAVCFVTRASDTGHADGVPHSPNFSSVAQKKWVEHKWKALILTFI